MTGLLAALRYEIRTLLRTREVYTTALVPSLLFVPLLMLWSVLVASVLIPMTRPTLAVPLQAPDGLGEFDETAVVRVEDPRGAVLAGEASAGVTRWWIDEAPETPWLQAEAIASHEAAATQLEAWLNRTAERALDATIERAGGRPTDRIRGMVARPPLSAVAPELVVDVIGRRPIQRGILVSWVVLVVSLSLLVLPLRTASDRMNGVLEAWAVTAGGATPLLVVRILSTSALFLVVSLLFPAALFRVLPFLPVTVGWGDTIEAVLSILVANGLLVIAGLLSTSTRSANQLAGITVTALGVGTGAGLLTEAWPWVPMAGFGLSDDPVAQGVRLLLTAGVLGLVLLALPWVARGRWVLPAGERDD